MSSIDISVKCPAHIVDVQSELLDNLKPALADKVFEKVGTKSLYKTSCDEDVIDLAAGALRDGIQSDWDLTDVKSCIFVSENQRLMFPGNGNVLASMFSYFEKSFIINMNSGCTGFVDSLFIASALGGKSLIICSESYSKRVSKFNRSVSPIFSDAAAAVMLDFQHIQFTSLANVNDSSKYKSISCGYDEDIRMDGSVVYEFVISHVLPLVDDLLSRKRYKNVFIHQGSALVLEAFSRLSKKYNFVIHENLGVRGNTVSATIPILLYDTYGPKIDLRSEGPFLLVAFGVGLSASIGVLEARV